MTQTIEVVTYRPEYASYFATFNEDWISENFTLEALDKYVLSHPDEAILNKGGEIFFAKDGDDIIGTVALKWIDDTSVELTKMAVDKNHRGKGAGVILCEHAIAAAKARGAKEVILYSNTKQATAIRIYRKLGFIELPLEKGVYERADIKMHIPFK